VGRAIVFCFLFNGPQLADHHLHVLQIGVVAVAHFLGLPEQRTCESQIVHDGIYGLYLRNSFEKLLHLFSEFVGPYLLFGEFLLSTLVTHDSQKCRLGKVFHG
jgi:hypothetical protein